jgi:hypothetical protein
MSAEAYIGVRKPNGDADVKRSKDHRLSYLPPRHDIVNHSPTGFEWGYGGSGPAQLALAILADALDDDERADLLHQEFKWRVIAPLDRDAPWRISRLAVLAAVEEIEREWAA